MACPDPDSFELGIIGPSALVGIDEHSRGVLGFVNSKSADTWSIWDCLPVPGRSSSDIVRFVTGWGDFQKPLFNAQSHTLALPYPLPFAPWNPSVSRVSAGAIVIVVHYTSCWGAESYLALDS